jgi:manganese/zinc/iron transport system permease protein
MFAIGTILVSKYFANVHLDTDAVLYGSIEFSNFDRLIVGERDLGPQSLWVMGVLLAVNLLFIGLFYKELKLTTFDAALAAAMGFSPALAHYTLMSLLSLTTVGAFTSVGAILVIALIVVPAATAYLLTDRLAWMLALSAGIGALSAYVGYKAALEFDVSISGSIVSATGALFLLALFCSPSQGMAAKLWKRRRQREQFGIELLIVHLLNHRDREAGVESTRARLLDELAWPKAKVEATLQRAERRGLLARRGEALLLTDSGVRLASVAMER